MKTDNNYTRWWKIMNYPLKFVPISDLKWASKQPYNSLSSKKSLFSRDRKEKT